MAYTQAFVILETRVSRVEELHFWTWCTPPHSLEHCFTVSSFEIRKIAGQHEMSKPQVTILR